MAGHSKWANIKFRKSLQDAKRGKLFTKYIREITISARLGGGDVHTNPRLRAAVDKALSANMTRDTIDRAIKRGAGGLEGQDLEEIRYEGYGPGGVAIIVDCMSDNRNRTVSEVRHIFTKNGGNLGIDGSVAYLFNQLGIILFAPGTSEEKVMEISLDAGAKDIHTDSDGSIEVQTEMEDFNNIKTLFDNQKLKYESAEITMVPINTIKLEAEAYEKFLKMVDSLEDLDDVQTVYFNAEIEENFTE
ncbi:MAG: YebC/PmpR family DNA-binding transcriptional regulator [Francisellaceae bacterium]|nr:YebC/PmpR family DNA-binding transcriptional regulator [Francisellaceae bacterium]